jgi:hypothetical protein
MIQRLDVGSEQDAEVVRKSFDDELGVAMWQTPGRPIDPERETDPDAPAWWAGEEDASQTFLNSMGVVFPNG